MTAPTWVLPAVIGITFLLSLGIQLINFKMTDQKLVNKKKREMKELQKSINVNSTQQELKVAQDKLMAVNSELMKLTMKPTMYTFVPLLLAFWALGGFFSPFGDLIQLPINLPLFGTAISWFGVYFIFSFVFSLTLKPLITKVSERFNKEGEEVK
ncbi:MAG: EMC3/TMCO1 family protein [Candidatus Nanoarchaeia archaeon]|jgi:uncharacterized membrane protein (DUF106 family)